MELFLQLFGDLLDFVYHCFDRIVINGYLSSLSRPEQVVYFFRQVLGIPAVSKEVLRQRTDDSCSSTSASAVRLPTAASITNPTRQPCPTANWKPPTTRQTRPSRTSLTCYKRPDVTARLLKYSCLRIAIQESIARASRHRRGYWHL
jgi:hypothetical protein